MCEYAVANKIPNIIIGGDLNDTKGVVNARSFILFQNIIDNYQNINFIMIPGNHDATMRVSEEWAIELIKGNNVTIYTKPTVDDIITYIPWSADDLLTSIQESEPNKILISHLGLNEAHMPSGISLRSSIRLNHLKHFDLVLLGHYHSPQHLENTYYVGSPIPLRRDEVKDIKRFLSIDAEGDTIDVKSIETTGYRRYIEIIIDEDSDPDDIKNNIIKQKDNNNFVVVRNNCKEISTDLQLLISNVPKIQFVNQYQDEFNIRGITAGMVLEEQMAKFLEIEAVDKNEHEQYIKVGLSALGDINNG
jgi:DNA repair exonuclease SbcCD nuclease subunit